MRGCPIVLGAVLVMICSAVLPAFGQNPQALYQTRFTLKPGLRIEYFSRKIAGEEGEDLSDLKVFSAALHVQYDIQEDFYLQAFVGFASSDFQALVFRRLPFSVELEAGAIQGILFGLEAEKRFFRVGDVEIGVYAQAVYKLGKEERWKLEGLNVEGSVFGKPSWTRVIVGPVFTYAVYENFSPYLRLCYNNLWGRFRMQQKIQTLEGEEDKEIKSKGLIDATLGSIWKLNERFSMIGEAHLLPYSKGVDYGFVLSALIAF